MSNIHELRRGSDVSRWRSLTHSLTPFFFIFFFSDPWVKANLHPVCFGPKDSQYGSFEVPSSGKIAAVKLTHLSGYVSCATSKISNWSFWGCGDLHLIKNHVSLVITTSTNAHLMPPDQFFTFQGGDGKWSELPGYNSLSPEIILPRFSSYSVSSGQELRLWYGEDLVDYTESDNGGFVCCDVHVLYV